MGCSSAHKEEEEEEPSREAAGAAARFPSLDREAAAGPGFLLPAEVEEEEEECGALPGGAPRLKDSFGLSPTASAPLPEAAAASAPTAATAAAPNRV